MLLRSQQFSPGTVYLEEKTRPSQHLSTSSDVSVKVEVEDRLLVGNRKLWTSQIFRSSETFPSDVKVDSPRSLEKTVDGDEDMEPNTYYGSAAWDGFNDHRSQGGDNGLGDEDFPVLDDQNSWSSFEISPLDMKDDFLSVNKIIADWDDIRSNKYHVTSKVST